MGSRRAAGGGAQARPAGINSAGPAHRPTAPLPAGHRAALRATTGERRHQQRAGDHQLLGDEREAVTIAELLTLLKLVAAIDARHRSAPPATG
jgi:hypothetical protein